jgi:hypothetical protein
MNCPTCNSPTVRRSHRNRWLFVFDWLTGHQVFRCRACRRRFHRFGVRSDRKNRRKDQRLRRWIIEAAIFVIMLVLFLAFLRYLTREHSAPDTSGALSAPLTDARVLRS